MKWARLKLFCISWVVFCFLSPALYSEVCYSDEADAELNNNLTQLADIVTQQDNLLTTQAIQIEQQASSIIQSEESIANSKQEILLLNNSLDAAENSWRRERAVLILQAGSIGIAIGIVGGVIAVLLLQ